MPYRQDSILYGRIFELPMIIFTLIKLMNIGLGFLNNIVIFDALLEKYKKVIIKN
jgi:DMSO reductase anchor subunit